MQVVRFLHKWSGKCLGNVHSRRHYATGAEHRCFLCGFSPRAKNISLYIMLGFSKFAALLERLGKHSKGKSCLYIKRLADVDESVLRELIKTSAAQMRTKISN